MVTQDGKNNFVVYIGTLGQFFQSSQEEEEMRAADFH